MQLTPRIHQLTIPFVVPAPGGPIPRSANVFIICTDTVTLIDSGVAGAEERIFACLREMGRLPGQIGQLILTHSHPDHVGAARAIREATGCCVAAHGGERNWIEDTALQEQQRPVPGFRTLVGGPVRVDRELFDGERLDLGAGFHLEVLHTPGHSSGSISLHAPAEQALITGDAVLLAGDMPIFDDYPAAQTSLQRLRGCDADWLLSAWDDPRRGEEAQQRIDESMAWLKLIRETVRIVSGGKPAMEPLELCRRVAAELGLPPFAVNPLVARSFMACLK